MPDHVRHDESGTAWLQPNVKCSSIHVGGQVTDMPIVIGHADLPSANEHLLDGVNGHVGKAAGGSHGAAFDQQGKNLFLPLFR